MKAIRSLLAATDFSPGAEAAVLRAAQLARAHGATLHLLHVIDSTRLAELRALLPGGAEAQQHVLEEARRALRETAVALGAEGGQRIAAASPTKAIFEASLRHDLLVLGAHGSQPVREALLGSTANRILLKSQRPILVVKRPPEGPYRKVVVPCEYAPPARRALELALVLAPEAQVTLVHAFELDFEGRLWRTAGASEGVAAMRSAAVERAQAWLDGLARGLPGAGRVASVVVQGPAGTKVVEMSAGADLVVMGKQGRSAAGEAFLGSVTRRVLAEASCDVLVFPASRGP